MYAHAYDYEDASKIHGTKQATGEFTVWRYGMCGMVEAVVMRLAPHADGASGVSGQRQSEPPLMLLGRVTLLL